MILIDSYPTALASCVVTMLCWGSWANTQKLASKSWPFQLFYWDYSIGVVLFALILAFTLGSTGSGGRAFLSDLSQADPQWLLSAFVGGVVFNLANILLVAAIDIAGMAVAFPVGIGLALVLGIFTTWLATGSGDVPKLAAGSFCIVVAIILDAVAYRRVTREGNAPPMRGIVLSVSAGLLMGWFYSFVARAMGSIDAQTHVLEAHKLSPYTALVLFSFGLFLSNFVWNSIAMFAPFQGPKVSYADYFRRGSPRLHAVGILGGIIWNLGMGLSILASTAAGAALSYGLGQGATMIGAIWGVFIWKEFASAPPGTNRLLVLMFVFYALGLAILISSKL